MADAARRSHHGRRRTGQRPRSAAGNGSRDGRPQSGGPDGGSGRGGGRSAQATAEAAPAVVSVPGHAVAGPSAGHGHGHGQVVSDAEVRANRRRAVTVAAGAGAVPGVVAAAVVAATVDLLGALVALVAVTAGVALAIWRRSTAVAVRLVGARPLAAEECPRLGNVLENLCATFGLRTPRVMAVDDPVPNACAIGRTPHDAVLVVTSGLLDALDLVQLEGVVAHELAHVRRHDTVVSGVAVTVLAPLARATGDDRWLHRVLGPGREYRADQLAVAAVRYPPGLHDALAAIAGSVPPQPGSVFEGRRLAPTRWLWIDPLPDDRQKEPTVGGLDAVDVRVAALAEL